LPRSAHRVHDRGARRDRAAAQIIAIGEAARDDDEIGAARQRVSACQTIAGSRPENSSSARAMSRSRLMPGKTMTADFIGAAQHGADHPLTSMR
jgi:hypothetical protein